MTKASPCPFPSASCAATSMREIALFAEDNAHRQVVGALLQRLANESGIAVRLDWRSAIRGHGRVVRELRRYLDDLAKHGGRPDLIVVATDANCSGLRQRIRDIDTSAAVSPVVLAVPDPHIERWLLLDGAAFKAVFDKGCGAPDQKCDRGRYKHQLFEAVRATGVVPRLGGIEFAEDIVQHMDIERAARADPSLHRFVDALRATFRQWNRRGR